MPNKAYIPILLADTSRMLYDERLEYRKLGLGQYDAATIILEDTLEKCQRQFNFVRKRRLNFAG